MSCLGYSPLVKHILSIPRHQNGLSCCRNTDWMEILYIIVYLSFVLFQFMISFSTEIKSTDMYEKKGKKGKRTQQLNLECNKRITPENRLILQSSELESLIGWLSSYCLNNKWVVHQEFWLGSQWRHPNPTSLPVYLYWPKGHILCLRRSLLEALSTDVALTKSSISLYHIYIYIWIF